MTFLTLKSVLQNMGDLLRTIFITLLFSAYFLTVYPKVLSVFYSYTVTCAVFKLFEIVCRRHIYTDGKIESVSLARHYMPGSFNIVKSDISIRAIASKVLFRSTATISTVGIEKIGCIDKHEMLVENNENDRKDASMEFIWRYFGKNLQHMSVKCADKLNIPGIYKISPDHSFGKKFIRLNSNNNVSLMQCKFSETGIQLMSEIFMTNIKKLEDNFIKYQVDCFSAQNILIGHQNMGFGHRREIDKKVTNANRTALKKIENIIDGLDSGDPSGLPQLGAITDIIGKKIEIYDVEKRQQYVIGEDKKGEAVQVEFHEPKSGQAIGHYTLLGGKEPSKMSKGRNMCLYDVISDQLGIDADRLKKLVLNLMMKNKIKVAEMYQASNLFLGGARYHGESPDDAGVLLDSAEGRTGFGFNAGAHSRSHAAFRGGTNALLIAASEAIERPIEVNYEAGDRVDIVGEERKGDPVELEYHKPAGDKSGEYFTSIGGDERYRLHDRSPDNMVFFEIIGEQTGSSPQELKSMVLDIMARNEAQVPSGTHCVEHASWCRGGKTAFISREEQNYVIHHALRSDEARSAMEKLNQYSRRGSDSQSCTRQAIHISGREFGLPRTAYGGVWENGQERITWPTRTITLVLQHFAGRENDPDAPVHLQTCYPRRPN